MNRNLLDIMVCPVTKGKLLKHDQELWSIQAALAYPIRDGIPVLLESEARALTDSEIESVKQR